MANEIGARMRLWDKVFGWKRQREAAATLAHAKDYLTPGSIVLDIGSGVGYALNVLSEDYEATPIGCDVVPAAQHVHRYCIFDGWRLPFADKSVDVAMLIFVLHHAEDAAELLREAVRVSRRAVLVVEDTPQTGFDARWGAIHIKTFNKRHNIPWAGRIRTDQEWRQLFRFLGLPLLKAARLQRFERLPPVARTAFIIEPPTTAEAQRRSLP
jgi:ubiquinone/menaquinone biosynthesis C-methylase UbiE